MRRSYPASAWAGRAAWCGGLLALLLFPAGVRAQAVSTVAGAGAEVLILALGLTGGSLPDIALPQPAPTVEPEPACFVIPRYAPGGFGWVHHEATFPQAFRPCYNLANGEEIICIRLDTVNTFVRLSLHRLNLRTGQRQALAPALTPLQKKTMAWSPTGWIAFSALGGDIWKIKANGDSLRYLTSNERSSCYGPTWSPDGRRLAYQRTGGPLADAGLCVMSAATGQVLQFVPDAQTRATDTPLAWSPDGQRLAFVGGPGARRAQPSLCVLNLSSNTERWAAVDTVAHLSVSHSLVWLAKSGWPAATRCSGTMAGWACASPTWTPVSSGSSAVRAPVLAA